MTRSWILLRPRKGRGGVPVLNITLSILKLSHIPKRNMANIPNVQKALYPSIPRSDPSILYPFRYFQRISCIPKIPSRASLLAAVFFKKIKFNTVKHSQDQNLVFKTNYHLNAGQKYYRSLQGGFLQYFWHSLSYHSSLRSFLSISMWPILAVSSCTHMRICIHVGSPLILIISKFPTSEISIF